MKDKPILVFFSLVILLILLVMFRQFHHPRFGLICLPLSVVLGGHWAPQSLCGPYGETESPSSLGWVDVRSSCGNLRRQNPRYPTLISSKTFCFSSFSLLARSLSFLSSLHPFRALIFYSWGVKGLRRGCGDRIGITPWAGSRAQTSAADNGLSVVLGVVSRPFGHSSPVSGSRSGR